jgi:hypothetical protein
MKEFDGKAVVLWGKLSERWIHAPGLVNRIVEMILKKEAVPGYAIIMPIAYNETELEDLEELRKYVSAFRMLIGKMFKDFLGSSKNKSESFLSEYPYRKGVSKR